MSSTVVGFVLGVALFGCGEPRSGESTNDDAEPLETTPFVCPTKPKLLAPIFGDDGLPYYEGRVHACRRFKPGTYSGAKIGWRTDAGMCTETPSFTWAVASPNAVSGFVFAPHVQVPTSGKIAFVADVPNDKAMFACVVLNVVNLENRSCIEACNIGGDVDSFWGNTGPDGSVINPVELEPLSVSPTAEEAHAWGNDKLRLMIDAFGE
jgi:hypothetical protein